MTSRSHSRAFSPVSFRQVLCAFLAMAGAGEVIARQPNIVVIFTDDHGYADLSCQQVFKDVQTPHIDALAAGGVRMTNGYITAPQCVPSRGGLLTGRYQNRFGLESNTQFQQPGGLDGFGESQTIAERLKVAGYRTGMAGKWHLGPSNEIVEHGFDKVFYRNSARRAVANIGMHGEDRELGPLPSELYHVDACAQVACSFVRRYRDEPFFFYLALRAPHVPLDAPARYLERFSEAMPKRRRQALAMLSAVDDGVGSILQTLRECELEENTLIFFISDNGAPLKIHKLDAPGGGPGWDGSLNDPLNGEKGMLTEGGIRTPFIASWKGTISPNQTYHQPVISLDVAATANAIAGLPDDPVLDGVNLLPFLTGDATGVPHETLYWRWNGQAALRSGRWKYLRLGEQEWIYDLSEDISESQNLLASEPARATQFRKQWNAWSQTLTPPGLDAPGSQTARRYFDWYLDGVRELESPGPSDDGKMEEVNGRAKKQNSLSDAELFERRDKNQDGQVTFEEFLNGRSGEVVEPLTKRFRARDKDRDGVWEKAEIKLQ